MVTDIGVMQNFLLSFTCSSCGRGGTRVIARHLNSKINVGCDICRRHFEIILSSYLVSSKKPINGSSLEVKVTKV